MSGALKATEATFHELQQLASDRDQGSRQSLFEKVCDLALAGDGEIAPPVQKLMDDVLLELIQNVEQQVRLRLAERLAPLKSAPPELLRHLARDNIEIARPILMTSPVLVEDDLVALVTAGKAHAATIARRPRITARVSDALIETEDLEIFDALAENQTAQLSRQALSALVSRCETHEPLQKALLARRDLPSEFGHQMFWWVSATLRRYILERFEIDSSVLDRVLAEISQEHSEGAPRVALKSGTTIVTLIGNLRTDKASEFRRDLAALLGVSEPTARRIINDPGGETLAVACRAMGADRSQFTTLLLLLDYKRYGRPRPTGHIEQVALAYDRLPKDRAKMIARLWDILESRQAA